MFSEQSRRTSRYSTWGIGGCAALAMAAGTVMAQQSQDQPQNQQNTQQKDMSKDQAHKDQAHKDQAKKDQASKDQASKDQSGKEQGWHSVSSLPGLRSDLILAGKTEQDKHVQVVFDNGRLVEAMHDNKPIDQDKIQIKGDQLRVMGESNNELVTFKLPNQILASGPGLTFDDFQQDRFQTVPEDRFAQDRFEQDRFEQDRFQQDQQFRRQTWSTQDQRSPQPYQPRESWDQGDDRFQMEHQRTDRFQTFDQPRYERETQFRQSGRDTQPTFRSSREMNQRGMYDSGTRTERMYGTTSEGRPVVLGIILDEADPNRLSRSNYSNGLEVQRVRRGLAADQAGLREGDIIVLIDDQPADTRILERRLSTTRSGDNMNLTVLRDGRERDLDLVLDSSGLDQDPSIYPRNVQMPNVDHPGPYSIYRPTRPEDSASRFDRTDRRIYSDFEMRTRDLDRDPDVYIYERDRPRDYDAEIRWRDRDNRREMDRSNREFRSRTYNTGEMGLYTDRDFEGRTYYTTPDPTPFERTSRTYDTGRDIDTWDRRDMGDTPLMPNEGNPGPFNLYRPTRPEVDDSRNYRPNDR